MKYIKDRFYNLRKNNLSLEAPAQGLFTREERTAFSCGLWVQRYDKFLKPPNFWRSFSPIDFWVPKARIKEASRSAIQASHHIDSASVSISYHRYQAPIMYRTLPTTLSLELRVQRYDNFLKPPNFRRSFFFRAPRSCVLYLLYIDTPSVTLTNKTCSPLIRLRHFQNPVLLSCECKGTTTFWNHQIFSELFSTPTFLSNKPRVCIEAD